MVRVETMSLDEYGSAVTTSVKSIFEEMKGATLSRKTDMTFCETSIKSPILTLECEWSESEEPVNIYLTTTLGPVNNTTVALYIENGKIGLASIGKGRQSQFDALALPREVNLDSELGKLLVVLSKVESLLGGNIPLDEEMPIDSKSGIDGSKRYWLKSGEVIKLIA